MQQGPAQNAQMESNRPIENGYHGYHNDNHEGDQDSLDSGYPNERRLIMEADNIEKHRKCRQVSFNRCFLIPSSVNPVEKQCLDQLKTMGYNDKSGWLIRVIKQVEGDFKRALAIVEEEADVTDGGSEQ